MIKNLASLKRALKEGKKFVFVKHFIHPECDGQIREPSEVGETVMYSKVYNEPEHKVSLANDGRGYRMAFGKASDWVFDNGMATCFEKNGKPLYTIDVLDD